MYRDIDDMLEDDPFEQVPPVDMQQQFWWEAARQFTGKLATRNHVQHPELLWSLWCDYCKSVDEKPIVQTKLFQRGRTSGPAQRPYNWPGFCAYVSLAGYIIRGKLDEQPEAFEEVVDVISNIMYSQKFEGAAAGIFNASVVMSDLQMKTLTAVETNGTVDLTGVSDVALAELRKNIK